MPAVPLPPAMRRRLFDDAGCKMLQELYHDVVVAQVGGLFVPGFQDRRMLVYPPTGSSNVAGGSAKYWLVPVTAVHEPNKVNA